MLSRSVRGLSSCSIRSFAAKSLVVAEHSHNKLSDATLASITAAKKIGGTVDVVVLGSNCAEAAKHAASIDGVSRVLIADDARFANSLPEHTAPVLAQTCVAEKYTHLIAPGTANGKNTIPRVAAKLDVQPIAEVVRFKPLQQM